jgi:hypothetical protein
VGLKRFSEADPGRRGPFSNMGLKGKGARRLGPWRMLRVYNNGSDLLCLVAERRSFLSRGALFILASTHEFCYRAVSPLRGQESVLAPPLAGHFGCRPPR